MFFQQDIIHRKVEALHHAIYNSNASTHGEYTLQKWKISTDSIFSEFVIDFPNWIQCFKLNSVNTFSHNDWAKNLVPQNNIFFDVPSIFIFDEHTS